MGSNRAAGRPPRYPEPGPGHPSVSMTAPAYRSRLLVEPRPCRAGLEHRRGGVLERLPWSRVCRARAAEVGEPQGVRTVVFDLWVDEPQGRVAWRLDAEPGEAAQLLARALAEALGDRAGACLKSLAGDGIPTRWYPDLASFEAGGEFG